MSIFTLKFLALAALSLAVGLIGHNHDILTGLAKAMAGVFTIMFFIVHFFGEKEA